MNLTRLPAKRKSSRHLRLLQSETEDQSHQQRDDSATHLLQCWTRALDRQARIRLADQMGNAFGDDGAA